MEIPVNSSPQDPPPGKDVQPCRARSPVPTDRFAKGFLAVAATVVFIGLLFRNAGIYASIPDEYIYSSLSRLLPLGASNLPVYLYLAIYRTTNVCGSGFLECARLNNNLFFVAAGLFIYLSAERVCTKTLAAIVAVLAILGPINSYTVYYMPEALYFFSFWLLTWFILGLDGESSPSSWCCAGILLGVAGLVKVRALFMLPAIITYILYVGRNTNGKWILFALRNTVFVVVFTLLTKCLVGYVLAGASGVTLFGPSYSSIASSTRSILRLLVLSRVSLKGHVLAICLMCGMPAGVAVTASLNSVLSKTHKTPDQRISLYACAVLMSLIVVASLFTVSVAGTGPYESMARLHMRSYNFALPLLLVVAASQLSLEATTIALGWRAISAGVIGLAIVYAVYTGLAPYTPSLIDCPELFGFTVGWIVFYVLSGISLFALALWVYAPQAGARTFVYLFAPVAVAFSTFYVSKFIRRNFVPDVYVRAGMFTRGYLPNEERSKLTIVGSDLAGLYKALFYIDNPRVSPEVLPEGGAYDLSKLRPGKDWLLVIGDHSLPEGTFFQLPVNDFTLARVTGTDTVDFKQSAWPGIIIRTRGLSGAEPGGTWSSGDVVTLEFAKPLPQRFTVHLVALAFGPNVGKEFIARVGDSAVRFTLGASLQEGVLEFNNPKGRRTIEIDVPLPSSPRQLGLSGDERALGILFSELRIAPL